jgi:hypothetical protein
LVKKCLNLKAGGKQPVHRFSFVLVIGATLGCFLCYILLSGTLSVVFLELFCGSLCPYLVYSGKLLGAVLYNLYCILMFFRAL